MPTIIIPADIAFPIRRPPGSTITLVNQSTVDIYIDEDTARLNATVAGVAPNGTRIAAAGGQIIWPGWPASGVLYARSATVTQLEVQP